MFFTEVEVLLGLRWSKQIQCKTFNFVIFKVVWEVCYWPQSNMSQWCHCCHFLR